MTFTDPTNYSLPSPNAAQNQVFGDHTRRDMSDYSQAAYNYLTHQQDNALQIALMNYMNDYNSPQHQMLQRQLAGINPYSDYNVASGAQANIASSPQMRSTGAFAKGTQQVMSAVNSLLNAGQAAMKVYDYMNYGEDTSRFNRDYALNKAGLTGTQAESAILQNRWLAWLTGQTNEENTDPYKVGESPQAERYLGQTALNRSQNALTRGRLDQVEYLINHIYPTQESRNKALQALDEYRLEILHSENDAVLSINTGWDFADNFLMFFLNIAKNLF